MHFFPEAATQTQDGGGSHEGALFPGGERDVCRHVCFVMLDMVRHVDMVRHG